jgi:hypothetical protein
MGANAVTTVPVYTAGEVLTAADLNITNSGIPVFAGTTERDAAFGGTGEKTLAEGQFAFLEDSNSTQFYDGANWVSVGVTPGMVLIAAQTIGTTVASVTVSSAFSATYDAYKIFITGGVGSSSNTQLNLTFGATTSGYSYGYLVATASPSGIVNASDSKIPVGELDTNILQMNIEVFNPFLAKRTYVNGTLGFNAANGNGRAALSGFLADTTSYTAFTLTPGSGTLTGGIIRVYGYTNS